MNVKRQLTILTVLVFVVLFFIGTTGFAALQHLQDNRLENQATANMLYLLSQKRLATDNYLLNQNTNTKTEWFARQTAVEQFITNNTHNFDTALQISLLSDISAKLQKSRELFKLLSALYEEKKSSVAIDAEKKMISEQMIALTGQTIQKTFDLHTNVILEEDTAFTQLLSLTTSATLLFFVLLLISFWIIWRRTLEIDNKTKELNNILDNLPVGVCLVSYPDGKPLIANPTAIAILGRDIDLQTTKENYCVAYHILKEDDTPYPPEEFPLTITLNTGKPSTKREIFIKKPNGKKIAIQVGAVPISNAQGKIVAALAVFGDITKEREIDIMKNEFISLASHQMRTPLAAIKWYLEMLMKGDMGKLPAKQMKVVSHINESNEHMIELINALLNVSRIESGRIIVEPVPTNIASLLKEIVHDTKKLFDEKKQTLTIAVAKDLPEIAVDQKLVRQVYVNLLTNANKYTQDGGKITISVSKKDDTLLSEVADSGYGIPEEEKKRVFEKFYRGSNIQTVEPSGTGLGLYLAKAIVESSGGKIWFDSKENEGTTFSFTLPLAGMKEKKGGVSID